LKLLIQALWDVARVKLVTGGIPQENKAKNFRKVQWKKMAVYLQKLVIVDFIIKS
jgi:hypothetical protein